MTDETTTDQVTLASLFKEIKKLENIMTGHVAIVERQSNDIDEIKQKTTLVTDKIEILEYKFQDHEYKLRGYETDMIPFKADMSIMRSEMQMLDKVLDKFQEFSENDRNSQKQMMENQNELNIRMSQFERAINKNDLHPSNNENRRSSLFNYPSTNQNYQQRESSYYTANDRSSFLNPKPVTRKSIFAPKNEPVYEEFSNNRQYEPNPSRHQFNVTKQMTIPAFETKLISADLSAVNTFFIRVRDYVSLHGVHPNMASQIGQRARAEILSLHPTIMADEFNLLDNETVETFLYDIIKARTKEEFLNELSKPLKVYMNSVLSEHNFAEFECVVISAIVEYNQRLSLLYDPENVNLCPSIASKENGLLDTFFKLIKTATKESQLVEKQWKNVPSDVSNRIKYGHNGSPPLQLAAYFDLLRVQMKDLKELHNKTNSFYAVITDNPKRQFADVLTNRGFNQKYSDSKPSDSKSFPKRNGFYQNQNSNSRRINHLQQEDYDAIEADVLRQYAEPDSDDYHDDHDDSDLDNQLNALQYDKILAKPANNNVKPPEQQGCHQKILQDSCVKTKPCKFSHDPDVLRKTTSELIANLMKSKYYVPSTKFSNVTQDEESTD